MACNECGANRKHMGGCSKSGAISKQPAKKGAAVKRGEQIPRPSSKPANDPCPPHKPTSAGTKRNGTTKYQCSRCKKYLGAW